MIKNKFSKEILEGFKKSLEQIEKLKDVDYKDLSGFKEKGGFICAKHSKRDHIYLIPKAYWDEISQSINCGEKVIFRVDKKEGLKIFPIEIQNRRERKIKDDFIEEINTYPSDDDLW